MKIGLNLYGCSKCLSTNFDSDLERLKQIGFTSIEVDIMFISSMTNIMSHLDTARAKLGSLSNVFWFDHEADGKMKLLKNRGFDVVSAHIMLDSEIGITLEAILPAIKNFGAKHGIKYFVVSYMKSSFEGMDEVIPSMNKAAEELKKDGRTLVYHNHETECYPVDGTTVLDYIMEKCPDVMLELDAGWAEFAGLSSVEFMRKYRDRLVLLHLKDIRQDAGPDTRATCFTAIGEGKIPLKEILAVAKHCNLAENGIIIDQDDSPGSIYDDYERGICNIKENYNK